MATETVFYFDVLGFRQLAEGSAQGAVDTLSALAEVLQSPAIIQQTKQWSHCYALSDSVFLTQADPVQALRQASDLVFNLVSLNLTKDNPVLVRGALAHGEVRHLKGIFLNSQEPANLVGDAVVAAVALEHAGEMKGPRLFLSEQLVQTIATADSAVAEWLLRPTVTPGVWEVLWLLPSVPAEFSQDEHAVKDLCLLSLQLLKTKGGHPHYGAHYREFALLAGRCLERVATFIARGVITTSASLPTFFPMTVIGETANTASGLPDDYVSQLLRLAESLERRP